MDLKLGTWEIAVANPKLLNLGIGQPAKSLLPWADVKAAFLEMEASQDVRNILQYSANLGTQGFMQELAAFLSIQYGFSVDPSCLFTTNGCSQAIEMICACFTSPGDDILVEEPSYHYVHQIFKDSKLKVHAAPQNSSNSLDVAALEVF